MYTYEYEKIKCSFNGIGPFNGNIYEIEDYKTIIEERSSKGWRYIGYIPTKQRGTGHIQELELIFEKQITNN